MNSFIGAKRRVKSLDITRVFGLAHRIYAMAMPAWIGKEEFFQAPNILWEVDQMRRQTFTVVVLAFVLALSFSAFAAAKTNLALRGTVEVDSAFSGYSGSVLNDGELNDTNEVGRWAEVAWASQEIPGEHYAEITLAKSSKVSGVSIYWAKDGDNWWMSSNFVVQYWDNGKWADLWEYKSNVETYHIFSTEITFVPVNTNKIRVLQREGGGPVARPNLMWLAEVQVWGD